MRITHFLGALAGMALVSAAQAEGGVVSASAPAAALAQMPVKRTGSSTADHSKFESLKGPFASAPEVTKACVACHTEASKEVMKSIHWTWATTHPGSGQELGKIQTMNSFCGSPLSNEPRCTSCHVGYGWTDLRQPPPSAETQVDCLVCHETSGTYKKIATDAGHPLYEPRMIGGKLVKPPDLAKIAQSVGATRRENCGACHFSGGGGDAVKHGDLDSSLSRPSRALDVHMAFDGPNMSCATCHTFNSHIPSGSRYTTRASDPHGLDLPKDDRDRATCQSCHGEKPHAQSKLNDHTDRIACQTCHIPEFARGGIATKMVWDWSVAGRKDDAGKPIFVKDDKGHLIYSAEKGHFEYGENVRPVYKWFNGNITQTTILDTIDDSKILVLNRMGGSANDKSSRIWPFKEMKGKQPYDPTEKRLVVNHVFGKDDTSFWTNLNIENAVRSGMEYAQLPWSGRVGFIETRMYWPITHMVAPKDKAVPCVECHTSSPQGRLAGLPGVYLPGRDGSLLLDILGVLAFIGVFVGVFIHALLRILLKPQEKLT